MSSPTSRSLAECRSRGWWVTIVERWVAASRIRQDAFGMADLLALDEHPGALLIQATDSTNHSKRVNKIVNERNEVARAWLAAGNRLSVWSWGKKGKAGKQKRWTLREQPITLELLEAH